MRTEMTDNALRGYLGLSWEEFNNLRQSIHEDHLNRLRTLDQVSPTLEQLAAKSNRPPKADEASDIRLEALSVGAFARLDAIVAANEGTRRVRGKTPQRGNTGRFAQEEDGRQAARERGYVEPHREAK